MSLASQIAISLWLVSVTADANATPLPQTPISDQGVEACHAYQFLEGSDDCAYYERLGEPPIPVTRPDETKLALRLTYGIGERSPVITMRFEFMDNDRALVKVYETTSGGGILFEGMTWLTGSEIARAVRDIDKYDFWSLPEKITYALPTSDKGSVETVVVCQSGLTIAGIESGKRHVVSRLCPEGNNDEKPLGLWRDLLRISHAHFPDLASDKSWQGEL